MEEQKKEVDLIESLTTDQDRILDAVAEVEKVIIGELLFAPYLFEEIASLSGDHFQSNRIGDCFKLMKSLNSTNSLDLPTLKLTLDKCNVRFTDTEISEWINKSTNATKIKAHADSITDCYNRRVIIDTCQKAIDNIMTGDISKIKMDVELSFEGISSEALTAPTCAEVYELNRENTDLKPISTGYKVLDDKLGGGIGRQSMVTIAAGTSVGKSTLALNILLRSAVEGRKARALFVCQEMGTGEIEDRCISAMSNKQINIGACRAMRCGYAKSETWNKYGRKYEEACEIFKQLGIRIYGKGSITTAEFRELLSKYHNEIDLLCLDYLQQVSASHPSQDIRAKVNEASDACKKIATGYGIPVLAVAQLNRESAKEDRPQLHHLKESSQIEQDSDVVIMLYREKNPNLDTEEMEVLVRKNRHGQLGGVRMDYTLNCGLISESLDQTDI